MTKEQVLAVLDDAYSTLRQPSGIYMEAETAADRLDQARAAIASWPEPGEAVAWRVKWSSGLVSDWRDGPPTPTALDSEAVGRYAIEYAYAAPPSMAALLAELRELRKSLAKRATNLWHGDQARDAYRHFAQELDAILVRQQGEGQ